MKDEVAPEVQRRYDGLLDVICKKNTTIGKLVCELSEARDVLRGMRDRFPTGSKYANDIEKTVKSIDIATHEATH
jgi:hypothetical protein